MQQSTIVVVPTLNEAANITSLVDAFLKLGKHISVLVADSDSPDGTGQLVREKFVNSSRVYVLDCRREQGRGAAIAESYRWISDYPQFLRIATADADFSHSPKDFPKLVEALQEADVVIGSRYLKKSKIVGWPIKRRVFSKAANTLAAVILRAGIKDYTNGYRLFRRSALEILDLDRLDADGFIMLSQELVQWKFRDLRIVEVPTLFINRARGQSNFRLALIIEAWREIWKLVGWSKSLRSMK